MAAVAKFHSQTHLHCNSNTALDRSTCVVAVPGDTERNVCEDTNRGQIATNISDMWMFGSDQEYHSSDRTEEETDHEDPTGAESIGQIPNPDARYTCQDVRWD